jgi:hypothetical protein
VREASDADRPLLERSLDGPEKVLLRLPWPSDVRILLKGTLGFLRQVLRSRALGSSRHA